MILQVSLLKWLCVSKVSLFKKLRSFFNRTEDLFLPHIPVSAPEVITQI